MACANRLDSQARGGLNSKPRLPSWPCQFLAQRLPPPEPALMLPRTKLKIAPLRLLPKVCANDRPPLRSRTAGVRPAQRQAPIGKRTRTADRQGRMPHHQPGDHPLQFFRLRHRKLDLVPRARNLVQLAAEPCRHLRPVLSSPGDPQGLVPPPVGVRIGGPAASFALLPLQANRRPIHPTTTTKSVPWLKWWQITPKSTNWTTP